MLYSAVEALAATTTDVPLDVEFWATTRPVRAKRMRNFMAVDSIMVRNFIDCIDLSFGSTWLVKVSRELDSPE